MTQQIAYILLTASTFAVLNRPAIGQNITVREMVVQQAIAALAANDQAALEKLSIDQDEFKKYLWPTMAAQASSNMTAAKYFAIYQKTSHVGISEAVTALGGRKWEVIKVSFGPPQRKGSGYQLFAAPDITLRDGTQEKTMRLVGGVLEHDGTGKVTNYYVTPTLKK